MKSKDAIIFFDDLFSTKNDAKFTKYVIASSVAFELLYKLCHPSMALL